MIDFDNMTQAEKDRLRSVTKRLPNRDRIESIRSVAILMGEAGDPEMGALLESVTEMLLDLRVAMRGGRRTPAASRHWPQDI